jgi:hypothetical protein
VIRPTASTVALLEYCKYFARADAVWVDEERDDADRGRRVHKAIALYATSDDGIPITVEDDIREVFARAREWFDSLGVRRGSASLHVEVSLAWDPMADQAEVIGHDRDYSRANGRLCGTADLVLLVVVDGKPVGAMVWDWKSGDGSSAGPQLRTLGLMVARAFGLESVTVAALEVRENAVTEVCREEMDEFALALWAGELMELLEGIAGAPPTPGSHCGEMFCNARLTCPEGQRALSDTVGVIPADRLVRRPEFRITDPITTPEHAMYVVDVIKLVDHWIDAKRRELKRLVPESGWVAADGRILKESTRKMRRFDRYKAEALCKQLGATDAQLESLYYDNVESGGLRVSGGATKPRARRSRAA